MSEKPNCYKCKYRGGVPGSAHSSCKHPDLGDIPNDSFLGMMSIFASVKRTAPFQVAANKLGINGHPTGIKGGWFIWPFNFDPRWLLSCNGFTQKRTAREEKKK